MSRQRKSQARRAAWDGKGDCERAVVLGVLAEARRVDRDFVREGTEGGEHAGAVHHEATAGLSDHAQRRAFLQVEHAGDIAAALQIDQRVGQDDVVLPDVLVVAANVLREFGSATCRRRSSPRAAPQAASVTFMKSGERPIMPHVVRAQFSIMTRRAIQLVLRARKDEGQPNAIAGRRRDVRHLVAVLRIALHVVERGDRGARRPPGLGAWSRP